MKTLRLAIMIAAALVILSNSTIDGQTRQVTTTVTVTPNPDNLPWCLNKALSGYIVYHLTYFVNKKTGFVEWVHANVLKSELIDEDGNVYRIIDTGARDSRGLSWEFWNNPNSPGWAYDIEVNQIPIGTMPVQGGNIWATFKWMSKGGIKTTMRAVARVQFNANGVKVVDFEKVYEDCDEGW